MSERMTTLKTHLAIAAAASLFALSPASAADPADEAPNASQSAAPAQAAPSNEARFRKSGAPAQQAAQAPTSNARAAKGWKSPSAARQAPQDQALETARGATTRNSRVAALKNAPDEASLKNQAASHQRFRAAAGGVPLETDSTSE